MKNPRRQPPARALDQQDARILMTDRTKSAQTPKQILLAAGLTAPWVADEEAIPCWCPCCGEEIESDQVLTFRECPACGTSLLPPQPEEAG